MRRATHLFGLAILLWAGISCPVMGRIIYVDDDANAPGDGKTWTTAYRYLQDALADAKAADKPVEIRVAQGVYKPDQGAAQKAGDRLASFALTSGVALKGGYAGPCMSDPNARDIKLYETILSGDLAGNDVLSEDPADFVVDPNDGAWYRPKVWNILIESTRRENSVHVLVASGTDQTAVLEGFTITGGNAYHPPYWFGDAPHFDDNDRGGAMLNKGGSLMVSSCTFIANSAIGSSGAVYNGGPCQPIMLDCQFLRHFSWGGGGAVENRDANVIMMRCIFERNDVWGGGAAAMYSWDSDLSLAECTFTANGLVGVSDGIVNSIYGHGTFTRCRFEANAGGASAALNNGQADVTVTDCDFIGNSGSSGGGFQTGTTAAAKLDNCTFILNKAWRGEGCTSYTLPMSR